MDQTHDWRTIYCSSCGHEVRFPVRCRQRFCDVCGPSRAGRARRRIAFVVHALKPADGYKLKLLTLTTRSGPDLEAMIGHLLASFRKLRNRKLWKNNVRGGLYTIEITRSVRGWHAHIHAILLAKFVPQKHLSGAWHAASGSPILDIRLIPSTAAIGYVTKYISKASVDHAYVDEVNRECRNLRLWSAFGIAHGINNSYVKPAYHCPVCDGIEWLTEWHIERCRDLSPS